MIYEFFLLILFIFSFWWLWMPLLFGIIFFKLWMYYSQKKAWNELEWILLEITPPKDIPASPKAVESIFNGVWGTIGTVSTKLDKYLKGATQDYFVFEIIGVDGTIHFYIRTQKKFRNLVEAHVYAQYPTAEIKEAADYTLNVPDNMLDSGWDLWGTVLRLAKKDCYPIRTYPEFIELTAGKDIQQFLDPLSAIMEIMSKLRVGEQVWIQVFVRAADDEWKKGCDLVVADILGKPGKKKKSGLIRQELEGWSQATRAVANEIASGKVYEPKKKDKKEEKLDVPSKMLYLSPGERGVVEAIENKTMKKGFETKIQFAYLGKKDVFWRQTVGAVMGAFNQFAALDKNALRPNKYYTTVANYLFTDQRKRYRKNQILKLMKERSFWDKFWLLNTEELASLWHFPTNIVKAPSSPHIKATTSEPPSNLPI